MVDAVGVTVIAAVVAPVFQAKLLPPDAVSVVLLPPHTTVVPAIVAVMLEFTVTVTAAVSAHEPIDAITE